MRVGRWGAVVRAAVAVIAAVGVSGGVSAGTGHAVVGGQAADAARYPWLAAIGTPAFFLRASGQYCGGILVAPDRVVTAAHCASFMRPFPQAMTVTFGRSNLKAADGITVGVKGIWVNPAFYETQFQSDTVEHNDTAVLTLSQPVHRPTLPIGPMHGSTGTVLGWGATSDTDFLNPQLESATIPIVPDVACAIAYGLSFDARDMSCAGSPKADTAMFDSGGPLLVDGKLAALTSWASGSARPGYPGVYARLDSLPNPLP